MPPAAFTSLTATCAPLKEFIPNSWNGPENGRAAPILRVEPQGWAPEPEALPPLASWVATPPPQPANTTVPAAASARPRPCVRHRRIDGARVSRDRTMGVLSV